jgi:hypothetical protein
MRCRRAERLILENELGSHVGAIASAELIEHLAGCPSCAARQAFERQLVAELGALSSTAAPATPATSAVCSRVMQRIERSGVIARPDDPVRGLGWATAAACAVGLFLALMLVAALPGVPRLLAAARDSVVALGAAWDRALPALVALFALPFRLLGPMLELAHGLSSLLGRLGPLAHAAALCACMGMIVTIATVVTRDLALGRLSVSQEER